MDHYEEDGNKVTSSCYIIMISRNCFIEGLRKLTIEVIKAFQQGFQLIRWLRVQQIINDGFILPCLFGNPELLLLNGQLIGQGDNVGLKLLHLLLSDVKTVRNGAQFISITPVPAAGFVHVREFVVVVTTNFNGGCHDGLESKENIVQGLIGRVPPGPVNSLDEAFRALENFSPPGQRLQVVEEAQIQDIQIRAL